MEKRVIITTSIPGSGTDRAIQKFKEYSEARGKCVKTFQTGEMIFKGAENHSVPLTRKNVLNAEDEMLSALRSVGLKDVAAEIPSLLSDDCAVVVSTHVWWYWEHRYKRGFASRYLADLRPQLFVNFLENVGTVEKALRQRDQWDWLFGEDKTGEFSRKTIIDWQSLEFESTKAWGELFGNDNFFTIPSQSHPSLLYRIVFEPWRKIYYFGMPLSLLHGDDFAEARKKIDKLFGWAQHYVGMVDPRFVEPLSLEHLARVDEAMYNNVVIRDLEYLIPNCKDGMIAYFPVVAYSAGVQDELRTVFRRNGETNLIYPLGVPMSPFLSRYSRYKYRNEDEFKKDFLRRLGDDYLKKVEEANKTANS